MGQEKQSRPDDSFYYSAPQILAEIRDKQISARELRSFWKQRNPATWSREKEIYIAMAEQALRVGSPFWAHDVASEGLDSFPEDLRLKQVIAIALLKSGSPNAAKSILLKLESNGHQDAETLSLLGSVHKEFWRQSYDDHQKAENLELACNYYAKAFENSGGDYYPGINAATLAVLRHSMPEARCLAQKISELCKNKEKEDNSHWLQATLAEAALILGDIDEARARYIEAQNIADHDLSAISSMRKQAELLLPHLGIERDAFGECFQLGSIIAFVGHMVDAPDRENPRFKSNYEESVTRLIDQELDRLNARACYTSAACGSDILLMEAMLRRGGEIHIVLPFARDSFIDCSVGFAGGSWVARCHECLERAASITTISNHPYLGDPLVFRHCANVITGLASLRARSIDAELIGMAVWDGTDESGGPGGVVDTLARWKGMGIKINTIPVDGNLRQDLSALPEGAAEADFSVKAILFTDVVGFSKLTEQDTPVYIDHFLGQANELIKSGGFHPIVSNTWGDALFLVFDTISEAGRFGLALRKMVDRCDWKGLGLSRELNIRMGLHAGPVALYTDPFTGLENCLGSHVNRAARIEPIAEEGQVYVSDTFAALASLEPDAPFTCEYVGIKMLAKKFGSLRLYMLRDKES